MWRDDNDEEDVDSDDNGDDKEGGLSLTREIHVREKFHSIHSLGLFFDDG